MLWQGSSASGRPAPPPPARGYLAADTISVDPLANLLVNPGFEEGFTRWQNAPEVYVANGWVPWWHQGTPDETARGYLKRPEFKSETAEPLGVWFFHGEKAQHYFSSFGSHDSGLYQQVQLDVPSGTWLEFSAWVRVHTSDCDDSCVSPLEPCNDLGNSHGTYRVSVGIDPYGRTPEDLGATPPDSSEQPIAWSPLEMPVRYDMWVQLKVTAQAQSDHVTVYLRGYPEWPVKHNDAWWDETALRVLDSAPSATDTPGPTWTASPTRTKEPTNTPKPTRTPTVSPTSTQTPVRNEHTYLPVVVRQYTQPTPLPTDTPPPTDTSTPTDTPPPQTATPTATPSTTATATGTPALEPQTATPTGTPSGTPPACPNLVVNGDFEAGDGWSFIQTERPPAITTSRAYSGTHALRVGVETAGEDVEGWSIASQTMTIPADAGGVTIRFAYYGTSADTTGDWQQVVLRTGSGIPVKLLVWLGGLEGNTNGWRTQNIALSPELVTRLRGTDVQIEVEVYNDGDGLPTALYIDDVDVQACAAALQAWAAAMGPQAANVVIRDPIRYWIRQDDFDLPYTCSEPEFESVQLQNDDTTVVDLSNWTLTEQAGGNVFRFPNGTHLQPGARLRIWVVPGPASTTDLHWGRYEPLWNNKHDTAVLRDTGGNEVARRGY